MFFFVPLKFEMRAVNKFKKLFISVQLCRLRENSEVQDTLKLNFNENKFCVFSLKFSSDGKEILCGAYDGYIYVYDMESKRRAFKVG